MQEVVTLLIDRIFNFNIEKVMNSGQCFGISRIEDSNFYKVLSGKRACVIECSLNNDRNDILYTDIEDVSYWKSYFHLSNSVCKSQYDCICDFISSDNAFISKCARFSWGLILLKQDFWETTVSFIISQRKSIPAIRTSLNRIREKFGEEKIFVYDDTRSFKYKTFPSYQRFLSLTVEDLKDCGLGYRAKYLLSAAKWFDKNEKENAIWEEQSYLKDYDTAMQTLKEMQGVGDKVANCICIFALSIFTAFPVDVWIQRVLDRELIAQKDMEQYKDCKGLLQQVIFYYVINHKEEFLGGL